MDGKIFAGFIVLMLRTYLLQKIKGNHKTKNMTIEKALLELKKIKVVQMEG
ncbi:MAG: hypothetical protein FWG10_07910 [Eubacteriaceae bacterium]|nr:hypothetical protein [Eubacteriaceae bacterium]